MTSPLITQFENALIDLIEMYVRQGMSSNDINRVLVARSDDDHFEHIREAEREAKGACTVGRPDHGIALLRKLVESEPVTPSFDPIKIVMDGYVLRFDWSQHWVQVSITPCTGPTHYMRLPHDEFLRLRAELSAIKVYDPANKLKALYVKRWRTIIFVPASLEKEARTALAATPRDAKQLSYDESVEMLRLADDLEGDEVSDLDTNRTQIVTRALRLAAALMDDDRPEVKR